MATVRTIISGTDSIETTISSDNTTYFVDDTYDGSGDTGTVTITNKNIKLIFAPSLDVSSAFTLLQLNPTTGGRINITMGPGSTIGDIDIIAGEGNSIHAYTGASIGEVRHITSGSKTKIKGFGFGAQIERLGCTQDDCSIETISIDSKTGATGQRAVLFTGDRCSAIKLNIINSDDDGIGITGADGLIYGCTIQTADNAAVFIDGPRCRMTANHILGAGVDGLELGASADNGVIQANYITDGAADPVNINAGASNNVFTANRLVNQTSALGGTGTTDQDNNKNA
jgi:hypothetical protein